MESNIPKLHESSPLHRQINLTHIPQTEIHQLLVLVLPQPTHEATTRQFLSYPVRREPILRKAEVEQGGHIDLWGADLLLLFHKVGAADEANSTFVAEGREELEHGGGDGLFGGFSGVQGGFAGELWGGGAYSAGRGEGAIDVEEADGILDWAVGQWRVDAASGSHDCGIGWW